MQTGGSFGTSDDQKLPLPVRLTGFLGLLGSAAAVILGYASYYAKCYAIIKGRDPRAVEFAPPLPVLAGLAVVWFACSIGLLRQREWARKGSILCLGLVLVASVAWYVVRFVWQGHYAAPFVAAAGAVLVIWSIPFVAGICQLSKARVREQYRRPRSR